MSVEDSPEFKKALNEACETQYREFLYGKDASPKNKIEDTVETIQRQHKEIEEKVEEAKRHADQIRRQVEIMSNPQAREITESLHKLHSVESNVVCPQCGETDSHGNKSNGKPFCWKCQTVMISKDKVKDWIKPAKQKTRSYTFNDLDEVTKIRK